MRLESATTGRKASLRRWQLCRNLEGYQPAASDSPGMGQDWEHQSSRLGSGAPVSTLRAASIPSRLGQQQWTSPGNLEKTECLSRRLGYSLQGFQKVGTEGEQDRIFRDPPNSATLVAPRSQEGFSYAKCQGSCQA